MAIIDVRVFEISTSGVADLNISEWCFESTVDSDLGYRMVAAKDSYGDTQKWLAKDKNIQVKAITSIESSFTAAGYVKNASNGVITGGHVITITDIPDRYWNRDIGNGYVYPRTTTDNVIIGSSSNPATYGANLVVKDSSDAAISIISGTSDDSTLQFNNSTGVTPGYVKYNTSNHTMTLRTNFTTAMTIESNQKVKLSAGASTSINEFSIDGTLGDNSDDAVPTEKAVKTYVDGITGLWSRVTATVNRLEPKTITDHIVLGESIEPDSKEWVSINCINDWDGMGFTAFADTHVNAIRFSNTSSLRCEVGYDHDEDQFIIQTAGSQRFSINYSDGLVYVNENLNVGGTISNPNIMLNGNDIYEYGTNNNQSLRINYYGYDGGTTQFRDLYIGDGKSAATAYFEGSTKTIKGTNISLGGNEINEYATDAAGAIYLNYSGYDGGTTQFRNTVICDGKNNSIIFVQGSTKLSTFYGDIKGTHLIIDNNQINEYVTDANTTLVLNYTGYDGGTTRFRTTEIYNGKNQEIATFDGATKLSNFYGNVQLPNGTSVNDITTTLADPGDDDTLVTEKAIATFVNSKASPWSRNVGGWVYPTTTSDRAIIGSGSINPSDYNSHFAVYTSGSTTLGIISGTGSYGDLLFTDGSGYVYPGIISYHHGDDSMHFTVNEIKAMIINSSPALKLRNGDQYVNEFSTDGTLGDNSDEAIPTEKAIKTYVDANSGLWTRNVGGHIYPTNIGDAFGIGTTTAPYTYGYDMVVYYNGNTQIGIVSSTTGTGSLYFGDGTGSANQGAVNYDHSNDTMEFRVDNDIKMKINKYGWIHIGASASEPGDPIEIHTMPSATLHILDAYSTSAWHAEQYHGIIEVKIGSTTYHVPCDAQ